MRVDVDLSQSDLMYREEATAPRVAHAAYSLLDECGFDVTDFVIEEETQSDLARLLGLAGGVMRVRCQSTGEDRVYSTGLGSAWMASVLGDLDDGHFLHAVLRAGEAGVARRHSALARRTGSPQQADFSDTAPDIRLPEFGGGYAWTADRRSSTFVASGLGAF